jgi:hypothetical protein
MRSNIHIYCIGQHTKKNQRSYQYGFLFIHYILVVALVFSGRDYGGKKPHARTNENIHLQKPRTRLAWHRIQRLGVSMRVLCAGRHIMRIKDEKWHICQSIRRYIIINW